jgi:hypothetical protein
MANIWKSSVPLATHQPKEIQRSEDFADRCGTTLLRGRSINAYPSMHQLSPRLYRYPFRPSGTTELGSTSPSRGMVARITSAT